MTKEYLTISQIKKILRLKAPNAPVEAYIAERQLSVIHKAFNHLSHPDHRFIYIGDEVGLGKTYIALGVATLLRRYSKQLYGDLFEKNYYQDVVIVPKAHLQNKWKKEYHNFIQENYLVNDGWVKEHYAPIGEAKLHDKLALFEDTNAAFHIFRMSSFSLAKPSRKTTDNWLKTLKKRLTDSPSINSTYATQAFDKALTIYPLQAVREEELLVNFDKFKRLYAWLLNSCLPQIECLIVDEAHNFKHGIRRHEVATRNKVTARFFGAIAIENDGDLLADFPELKSKTSPKVEKLIFLSATPIDRSLTEIPRQLDCFLPEHSFEKDEQRNNQFIKNHINSFMIRGLMELQLADIAYSRNQYRHEHRKGNVAKYIDQPLKLDSDLHGLIMGVVQYRVIKEIGQHNAKNPKKRGLKNNKSFEIGMLASYESFNQSRVKQPEYEDHQDNKDGSIDKKVLEKIVKSYDKRFKKPLPHPKQDKLVQTLFEDYCKKQQKALVFVRRIGSVNELEQRLLHLYEEFLNDKILALQKKKKYQTDGINQMVEDFKTKHLDKNKLALFNNIIKYLPTSRTAFREDIKRKNTAALLHFLKYIFKSDNDFKSLILRYARLERLKLTNTLKLEIRRCVAVYFEAWEKAVKEDEIDFNTKKRGQEDEEEVFFYSQYFKKSESTPGSKYRIKTHRENWFELNYKLFNDCFEVFETNKNLFHLIANYQKKPKEKKRQTFNNIQEIYKENITAYGNYTPQVYEHELLNTNTFITKLLTEYCCESMQQWVDNNRQSQYFKSDLEDIVLIIKYIFNHGSGLLPAYLADSATGDFASNLYTLLSQKEYFHHVLNEINTIILDYDTIIKRHLKGKDIMKMMEKQAPIIGTSGVYNKHRVRLATQFKMPGFPYVLISTDVLKEGIDLHSYCQDVFHYGIAWNPTDMEQRTGRIDRIGSLSSRKIKQQKDYSSIEMDNKVHIFYPYLSDTLEVNQVKRVFENMNRFIEIFYKDLSTALPKERHVATDELIAYIPPPKQERLVSPFEHPYFKLQKPSHCTLEKLQFTGLTTPIIASKLNAITKVLENQFDFYKIPEIQLLQQRIIGSIHLKEFHNRRGPFSINVITHPNDSSKPALMLYSYVCMIEDASDELLSEINQPIKDKGYESEIQGQWLLGKKFFEWEVDTTLLVTSLASLIRIVDELEMKYTNKDELVFV